MATVKSNVKASRKKVSHAPATDCAASIEHQLRVIAIELRCALATISVATHALCKQNADLDADVAIVLRQGAGASVHAGLERIDAMLRKMQRRGEGDAGSELECVH